MTSNKQNGSAAEAKNLYTQYVVPSYGRFELVMSHGKGSYLWDVDGKRYLDLGSGIAVCCLGHSHPAIAAALAGQAGKLLHISNLYYHEGQGRLAEAIVKRTGDGKCFFCNSGAEANEGLYKLARKFGHEQGRFEIITANQSFHGRTMAGIAATGQDKVKKGFEPIMPGFRHVRYNDLEAVEKAISPATVAILIEGIQGEGGVTPATTEYLLGLRRICDEKNLLLLMDEVQCGHYRTGRFHSYQAILEGIPGGASFLPDGVSMAKSLAGGFPMGSFWVRQPYANLLSPGTHASTFGGGPLACAVALSVFETIEKEKLDAHARFIGQFLMDELNRLAVKYPGVIKCVRGMGLMIGFELQDGIPSLAGSDKAPSAQMVARLHEAGLLAIPAGTGVIRLLPPLNLSRTEASEGLQILETITAQMAI